ncbi:hypothetical protein IEQ34_019667 [Dendrobium chrysotoxum]|uniref:Calcineurin-like phosphoesterase domain-containing protein n=1 Tax=Dendrobium chrysotoxum TaxID=161865 RepID=A0AAV7G9M1_DENCH|nr:hypothetical protein IEQ34_019667 [Dendrobium chrysotoxum]
MASTRSGLLLAIVICLVDIMLGGSDQMANLFLLCSPFIDGHAVKVAVVADPQAIVLSLTILFIMMQITCIRLTLVLLLIVCDMSVCLRLDEFFSSQQLMDRTSLSLAPKSLALEAAKFYTDLYMRRSFHLSILPFKPNLVIFLGDHFDGGPFLSDQESKTEYMECNFSNNRPSEGIVTLADQVINKSTRFRYLGSIVQSDGDIDGDIISRIQVGWLKWRNASGLLCDRKVPLKLKGKFYKMVVRPAMLYGAECWPLKEKHNSKLSVAEMRMLRWMSGFTLRDRIRNEHIREKVGVAPVEDKIRESRLRWFGHVKRRPPDDPVRKVEVLDLTYVKKGRGRPKKTWWMESFSRFKHIFGLEEHGRYSDILVYYLCGNHDIGYSSFHAQHPEVIDRYEKEFGARNYHFSAGKVNFIVVDAQTLDGPKQEKETSVSWQFIKNISTANMSRPRVLLTHIPLYRPDDSPCGSYRSSGVINQRVSYVGHDQGIRYQNYLTKETSDRLLYLIKPSLVLSGHDHDQCTVTHSTQFGSVVETLICEGYWESIARYLCQFVVTLLLLFIWPTNGFAILGQFMSFVSSVRRKWANMKEKVDEEDCEYDMIWDSEGSMHLIKKNKTVPAAYSNVRVTGRGNAVLRSSAKKQSAQEQEQSISVEMNTDMNSEKTGKTRQNRSMMIRFVLRLIRVLRLTIIIAAVNVPLYMMLLFKDWIDR